MVDEKKAKKMAKEKRKARNEKIRSKDASLNETQAAVQKSQLEKANRDKALNHQRDQEAEIKAIAAQVAQLIKHYKLARGGGDQEYNFSDNKVIKKMYLRKGMLDEVIRGRLCIARSGEGYEVIPKPVADKILQRQENAIVVYNSKAEEGMEASKTEDDEYYAQFEIPDDMSW